ncbi:CHAT domain-containing protein [Streptomyces sp. EN27]|uniref:CHAT domain-containing protein n=1 Tax=Streptomyces sp. EN27 TaxID=211464 RepID=UPI000851BF00|nr:CHAT domain-containing protein [Streptomyces sp. EN27]
MTQARAEDCAHLILRQAERAEADPGVLEWFTGPEAARAAEEVLGCLPLPDGSTWGLGVLALVIADLFRYAARGWADRAALATALLRFSVIREQDPDRVPQGLRPVFATLAGEPEGAATEPGLAYDAGVGMMTVFQQARDPEVLRGAEVLLRHAATASGGGSVEQGICLSDLGLVLFYGFQDGAGRQALADAVAAGRAAVACAPGDRDEQARRHGNFGHTLRNWADVTGDGNALRESVDALRKAVDLATGNSPHREQHRATLGSALCLAADRLDEPALRSEGIALLRTALREPDAIVADRAALLSDLGVALFAEAVAAGGHGGLHEEGVAACRLAADTAPNVFERTVYLINLGLLLSGFAEHAGRPDLLDEACATAREALDGAPDGHPLRSRAHFTLSRALDARYTAKGSMGDLDEAVTHARLATESVPSDDVPRRIVLATHLAELLGRRAARRAGNLWDPGGLGLDESPGDPGAVDAPLALLRELAGEVPARSADRARVLRALGACLLVPGDADGAAEAVDCFHKCLALPAPTRNFEATTRIALGAALARRAGADAEDWPRAAAEVRRGLGRLRTGGPEYWDGHGEYAEALMRRAEATGDVGLCEEAVGLFREQLRRAPLSRVDRAVRHANVGLGLMNIVAWSARTELLSEAVAAQREAVGLSRPSDPFAARLLLGLGETLMARAEFCSDTGALDEGITVLRRAVAASHPSGYGGSACRTALGDALRNLARHASDPAPLEESVRWHREAVAVARGAPPPMALLGLANSLGALYRHSRDVRQSEEAVRLYQAVLDSPRPTPHGLRGSVLTGLGFIRWTRAVESGDEALGDLAVRTLREAAAETPRIRRGMALTNLGGALMDRGLFSGNRVWLAEAVTVLRRAVDDSPPTAVERSLHLNNLAEALRCWYETVGDASVADEAVALLREAMALTHGDRWGAESAAVNLGALLINRAQSDQDPRPADEARRILEEVIAGFGADHPSRPFALQKLATACVTFARLAPGRRADARPAREPDGAAVRQALRRAEAAAREALAGTSPGHALHGVSQLLLATAQLDRRRLGDRVDLAEAAHVARDCARSPVTHLGARLRAAQAWGVASVHAGRTADGLEAYAYAVGLLPRIAPRSLARADQEARLLLSDGMASDAAALAIGTGAAERALTLLEQGRGVLLAQGLENRADASRLRTVAPGLAAEFERIRERLSRPPRPSPVLGSGPGGPTVVPSDAAREAAAVAEDRLALARRWEQLLEEIRALPGLDGFLRPPSVADLVASAAEGPVVVVNVSAFRCDALVVTADAGIDVVPLPRLTLRDVEARAAEFVGGIDTAYGERGVDEAVAMMRRLSGTLGWLWDAVAAPVLEHLGLDSVPHEGDPWPRVWWCATGLLSFLPLHAAGRGAADSGTWVLDRAVSSYTPTVRALVRARDGLASGGRDRPAPGGAARPSPLVVALAETPGAAPLAGVAREVELLGELFPGGRLLAGPEATVAAVGRALEAHPWVHFSCHGVNEPLDPSRSGLVLYDGRLTVSDAAAQRPGSPELAVLSACSAAQGGMRLSDEAVQLASSFQLAGYPHVIGTLWPVADKLATRLTEEFYAALAADLDRGRPIGPATALHHPVRALRDRYPQAPHLWAAHIHTGP